MTTANKIKLNLSPHCVLSIHPTSPFSNLWSNPHLIFSFFTIYLNGKLQIFYKEIFSRQKLSPNKNIRVLMIFLAVTHRFTSFFIAFTNIASSDSLTFDAE